MRIGIAADHGGFELKVQLTAALKAAGYEVADFGAHELVTGDDYPDFVVPLARAVARGDLSWLYPERKYLIDSEPKKKLDSHRERLCISGRERRKRQRLPLSITI